MQQKRRRLVAETADDLQQILFGDADESETPGEMTLSADQQQAIVPAPEAEAEVGDFSDSDKDSMDDFIVRDSNEEREHRFVSDYSGKYGDDVAEGLNEVIAIFGDLRILDIYTQGDLPRVKRIVETTSSLEERFDPEEVAAQLASSRDALILSTDVPERFQEEMGTEAVVSTLECFELGIESDKLETEWRSEAVWLYSMLVQQYRRQGKKDWTLWTPTKIEDEEAKPPKLSDETSSWHEYPDSRQKVVDRLHVFLRDFKGRAMDPVFIWHSMSKAKYCTFLTLSDLQNAQALDGEWSKLWAKRNHVESKLMSLLAEVEGYIAASAAMSEEQDPDAVTKPSEDPDAIVKSSSVNQLLAETARTDLFNLLAELRFASSPEGMGVELSELLDDVSASLGSEIEPMILHISESSTWSPSKSSAKKAASLVSLLISNNLQESLLPVLSLSPREVGDNLSMGARMNKGPFAGMVPPPINEELLTGSLKSAVVDFLSATISTNIKVRKWFRSELRSKAALFTHPIGPVSATKRLYGVRRLAGRPVEDLVGTEVMAAVQSLVTLNEVSVDLAIMDNGRLIVEGISDVPESLFKRVDGSDSSTYEDDYESLIKNALSLKAYKESASPDYRVPGQELVASDPLFADLLQYMTPENRSESPWLTSLRHQVARSVIAKLYKTFKSEILAELIKDSCSVTSKNAAVAFGNLLKMKPFDPRELLSKSLSVICDDCKDDRIIREAVRRRMGFFSVLSVIVERVMNGFRTHIVIVNHRGDVVETASLDSLLTIDGRNKDGDRKKIASLIERHLVSLIIIGVDDRKARGALAEMKSIVHDNLSWNDEAWTYFKSPEIHFGDLTVPMRVAKQTVQDSMSMAVGASLARYQQNPAAEILSLWSDVSTVKNTALTIPVHDLQSFIPKPVLERDFLFVATRVVAEDGVDLNDAILSDSRKNLLKFVPGLGPRKARSLTDHADAHMRGLDVNSSSNASRSDQLKQLLGERVFRNAQPFLRLFPDCDKVALFVQENGLSVSRRRRTYSSDSSDSSRSSYSSSSSSSSSSSGGEYFGVSNSIVQSLLEGFNYLELCRFGQDCWPTARQLYSLAMDDSPEGWFGNMGDWDTNKQLLSFNPTSLIDEMFEDMANVPEHLRDVEIELEDLKDGTGRVFGSVVLPQLSYPFHVEADTRVAWRGPTKLRVFYAMVKESESELNKWTVTTLTVTETGKWIKMVDSVTGLEGWLERDRNDSTRYNEGDSVTCRVSDIDVMKLAITPSVTPVTEEEKRMFSKYSYYLLPLRSDFEHLENLGKVEVVQKSVVKSRRIIKHDSFFEIPHGAAVEKLMDLPVGDVIFRPSSSQPGVYFGLIKIMNPSGDASREDWIKTVRFVEGPSTRTGKAGAKMVFKLLDFGGGADEFEEFDQMKVVYVDKYMRYLSDLRAHPKFRPENLDQVRNMLLAKMRSGAQSSVAYSIVMDPRRECSGNALLLWAADRNRVHEDVIEITHRGYRWWTKGPYPSINSLLTWWKQGGYRERPRHIKEWQDEQARKSIVS